MKQLTRRLPFTHQQRLTALESCLDKKNSNPPGGIILTNDTVTLLDSITPAFALLIENKNVAKARLAENTPLKNKACRAIKRLCASFMNGINLAIDLNLLGKGDKAYYGMEIESGRHLRMTNENEIKQAAQLLIDGEALRIGEGGTAISMPAIGDVIAAAAAFKSASAKQSNLAEALNLAQRKLNKMAGEVDKFIKRLWGEIEARYAAEPDESRRAHARRWGVVYSHMTVNIGIMVTVVDEETKQPAPGARVELPGAVRKKLIDEDGRTKLFIHSGGVDNLTITADGYEAVIKQIDTSDEKSLSVIIEMRKAA